MEAAPRSVGPRATLPSHDTRFYRNVRLAATDSGLLLTDSAGNTHLLRADALAWVTGGQWARLLVLDAGGAVLADIDADGWDIEELADFGDAVGVPLVEDSFADSVTARAAYPLPRAVLRVHAKDMRAVALQFLPVVIPVAFIILLVLFGG